MKMPSVLQGLATASALAVSGALAQSYTTIPPIEVYGQHFFYTNNGSQFFLKGVAYQQDYNPNGTATNVDYTDPLADGASCARDIPYMKQIFTNIIRVYALDPTQNHDDCMTQLASNDIYVVADLSAPSTSIDSNDPSWDLELYNRYTSVVDAMAKYNNVLGFFAGNEVILTANQTASAAFVKAAVRDTKAYIKSAGYRTSLGVGYATADVPSRDDIAHYFACDGTGAGNATTIDFWGYNVYSWCGDSNYVASSYGERYDFFKDFPVPAFFAEYGCNQFNGPATSRPFTEVAVLYGNMSDVFSGGIVYEWFMEANDFGLVSVSGSSVSVAPDFTSLMSQLAKVTPSITQSSAYSPSNTLPACPTVDASWAAQPSPLPPPVNPALCACEYSSLGCTVQNNNTDQYGSVFNYICGNNANYCSGIARNATTGSYGAYSGCSAEQQLAFVVNQYYVGQSSSASACDFSGLATTQSPSTASTCATLLSAAGSAGTGSVLSPTGVNTAAGSGSGGSGSSSSSKAAAVAIGGLGAPTFFEFGKFYFVVYVALGLVSGLGMIVL